MSTTIDVAERFWANVKSAPADECWEWMAAKYLGYGQFRAEGKTVSAHRWSYEHMVAPIPSGLHIDHLCRNRACVNPDHLEPVTQRVNNQRQPRAFSAAVSATCGNGHEWTEANTYHDPRGFGACRACRTETLRRHRDANRDVINARARAAQAAKRDQLGDGARVRVGQVWADCDWRMEGRTVRVDAIDGSVAIVTALTAPGGSARENARRTRVRLNRFRPTSTGYRLVEPIEATR